MPRLAPVRARGDGTVRAQPADWTLRATGTEESERGLLPQHETTKKTLVVAAGPERLPQLADTLDFDPGYQDSQRPYFMLIPSGLAMPAFPA